MRQFDRSVGAERPETPLSNIGNLNDSISLVLVDSIKIPCMLVFLPPSIA